MKLFIILLFAFFCCFANGQTFNPFYENIVATVQFDSIKQRVDEYTAFGVKEVGSEPLNNTKNWIVDHYSTLGYTDIFLDSFAVLGESAFNVVVTKQGAVHPDTYLIIGAHYDTKNGRGSNDNGSGTAILLEMARALKDIETEYSIRFIHFSGNENGLYGSKHYVDSVVIPENMDILHVFNIDQVGGLSSMTNDIVICQRDESAPLENNPSSDFVTLILAGCMELYSNLDTEISYALNSDYMPFQEAGEIVTGLFEKNESLYIHTFFDDQSNMDMNYVFEIAKGSIGAALQFAIAITPNAGIKGISQAPITVAPNPTNGSFSIAMNNFNGELVSVEIIDLLGRTVHTQTIDNFVSPFPLTLRGTSKGVYQLVLRKGTLLKTTKITLN